MRRLGSLDWALIERQEVVVPLSVRVRTNIGRLADFSHNTNLSPFTRRWFENVERIRLGVDALDDALASPHPGGRRVADVGDVLVGALRVGFDDAGDLAISHVVLLVGCNFGLDLDLVHLSTFPA